MRSRQWACCAVADDGLGVSALSAAAGGSCQPVRLRSRACYKPLSHGRRNCRYLDVTPAASDAGELDNKLAELAR